jgi:hypothetical protein
MPLMVAAVSGSRGGSEDLRHVAGLDRPPCAVLHPEDRDAVGRAGRRAEARIAAFMDMSEDY